MSIFHPKCIEMGGPFTVGKSIVESLAGLHHGLRVEPLRFELWTHRIDVEELGIWELGSNCGHCAEIEVDE